MAPLKPFCAARIRAFTLIEILITIGILAILSVVALTAMQHVFPEGKRLRRITDLRTIQHALSEYASDHGAYPISAGSGANWNSQCAVTGILPPTQVVPGLVPAYIAALPSDPDMNPTQDLNGIPGSCCYLYKSNGTDYKIIDFNCPTANYADPEFKSMGMVDPIRPGPNMPSFAIGLWTPGGAGW